jgi:hypothetical protein
MFTSMAQTLHETYVFCSEQIVQRVFSKIKGEGVEI